MIKKKTLTPIVLAGIFCLMLGLSFAAVPLYDLFCRVTGFGGTTQVSKEPPKMVLDKIVSVRFDTNVNNLMWDGKKSTALKIFYDALDIVDTKKQDNEKSSLEIWKDGLSNVMPHVEVRSRRIGGATFQIPMQIRADRKISLAIKWLISFARKRNEKSMAQKLAAEILAAEKEEGSAVKKKVDTHKMAEANKAFSHFRF